MGTTANRALRYPEGTVAANTLHTQIKNLADDVDAQLTDSGWLVPTLLNGWVNYGNVYASARYRRKAGIVYLQGLIAAGGGVMFVLPAGYRPSTGSHLYASVTGGNTATRTDINGSTGEVSGAAGSNSFWSLDGICFPADL